MSKKSKRRSYKLSATLLSNAKKWIMKHGLSDYGGATKKEYCEAMGIDPDTHNSWVKDFPHYETMVNEAKEVFRQKGIKDLVGSLMETAIGGYHRNTIDEKEYKPSTEKDSIEILVRRKVKTEKRWYPPNVEAAKFLLSNMDPDNYSDRRKSELIVKEEERELSQMEAIEYIRQLEKEYKKGEED